MIKGIVLGFVLAVAILVGGFYCYFAYGMAPVAAADPPMPFEKKLAHLALNSRLEKQNPGESPVPDDETNLLAGAEVYKNHCAACHGSPAQPSAYKTTMFPPPTPLFEGKGVTDDPASESYWKVVNGIRMTGMPSFKNTLSAAQSWQVSQLVAHAKEISPAVMQALMPDMTASSPPPVPAPAKNPSPK